MLEVYKGLAEELAAGRPAVMAGIVRQAGSSPRSLGTKFLVRADGSIAGSIGGGSMEARVIDAAMEIMGRDVAMVLEIRLSGKEVAGTDMICGGNVDVLLQAFLPQDQGAREALDGVLRLLEKGGHGILAVGPIPDPGRPAKARFVFYRPESGFIGPVQPEEEPVVLSRSIRIIGANAPEIVQIGPQGPEMVLEPVISNPTVFLFGGGHISVHLAPLLHMVGFKIVVVEDRNEFAGPERFPQAAELVVDDYERCFERLDFTPETYSVIVTRGHLHDKVVLAGVLARPGRYVGMIGSRRKRNMIYNALLEEGVSPDLIRQVHSPIGLPIGAETPEEIALAIAAELVKVRAEGLRAVKEWKV